jgi:hypothetical protein
MIKRFANTEKQRIHASLAPLGERMRACIEYMHAHGFNSFDPRVLRAQYFCELQEIDSYWKVKVEGAKEQLTGGHLHATGYSSPLLEKLRSEWRARIGFSQAETFAEFLQRNPGLPQWKREVLPWEQRRFFLLASNPEEYKVFEATDAASRQEIATLWKQEVATHASGLSKSYYIYGYADPKLFEEVMRHTESDNENKSLTRGRFEQLLGFYKEVMQHELGPLGFTFSSKQSSPKSPVFSKPLAQGWYLAWSNEMFCPARISDCFDSVELALSVRGETLKGAIDNKEPENYLQVKYTLLVPGFYYKKYASLDELETAIKAYTTLYSFIAPQLEAALLEGIGQKE